MKKIKVPIMTLAILLSIGSAFATRMHFDSKTPLLYYWDGHDFLPAGTYGVDFVCVVSTTACTYTLVNGVYTPYQLGAYVAVDAHKPSKNK